MADDPTTNCDPHATSAPPRDPLWEWTARIHISKDELRDVYGGSGATFCIFLGAPPEDPNEWLLAPNLAGSHHVLGNSGGGARGGGGHGYGARHSAGHGGGAARGGSINEGFVHLNAAISRHSGLHSFDPEVVVPYLKRELEWRAQKVCHFYLLLSVTADEETDSSPCTDGYDTY